MDEAGKFDGNHVRRNGYRTKEQIGIYWAFTDAKRADIAAFGYGDCTVDIRNATAGGRKHFGLDPGTFAGGGGNCRNCFAVFLEKDRQDGTRHGNHHHCDVQSDLLRSIFDGLSVFAGFDCGYIVDVKWDAISLRM